MDTLDGRDARGWRDKWRETDLERLRLRDALRRLGADPDAAIQEEVVLCGLAKPDLRDPNI